jgi:hypothetical protein
MSSDNGDGDPGDTWAAQERFKVDSASGEDDDRFQTGEMKANPKQINERIDVAGDDSTLYTFLDGSRFLKVPTANDRENASFDHEPQIASSTDSVRDRAEDSSAGIPKDHTQGKTNTITPIEPASPFAISDLMNDNLLVARYGLMASIALLTAYGISQSPLLFRYRTVAEIPANYFLDRRILHCRLVAHETTDAQRTTLWCRHLSLAERLLAPIWWKNRPPTNAPSSSTPSAVNKKDCIPFQLVGLEAPIILPTDIDDSTKESSSSAAGSLLRFMSTTAKDQAEPGTSTTAGLSRPPTAAFFLDELVKRPTYVSCQLMARGVVTATKEPAGSISNDAIAKKRPIPGHIVSSTGAQTTTGTTTATIPSSSDQMLAFGKIWYRPKGPFQVFATDLGLQLVERGEAVVATGLYGGSVHPGLEIVVDHDDQHTSIKKSGKQLHRDAMYVAQTLADGEKAACRKARGVWNNELYRRQRQDFVNDVEFWDRASWPRKLWRWMVRGG